MNQSFSGAGAGHERGAPAILRLLPHVHHPPARVMLPWPGDTARALDARGYRVSAPGPGGPSIGGASGGLSDASNGAFDLVCETGGLAALSESGRATYAAHAARALRPGGILFGVFPEADAGALLSLLGAWFDAARLEPSASAGGWLEGVFVRR